MVDRPNIVLMLRSVHTVSSHWLAAAVCWHSQQWSTVHFMLFHNGFHIVLKDKMIISYPKAYFCKRFTKILSQLFKVILLTDIQKTEMNA